MKRSPIRSRSAKARAQDRARAKTRAAVFERAEGRCETCPLIDPSAPPHQATEVHELLMRSLGGSIVDLDNCVATCRRGHSLVHDNPREATRLGLLRPSGPVQRV